MELRGRMIGELLDSSASMTTAQLVVTVLQIPRIYEHAPEVIEGSVIPTALPPATPER